MPGKNTDFGSSCSHEDGQKKKNDLKK